MEADVVDLMGPALPSWLLPHDRISFENLWKSMYPVCAVHPITYHYLVEEFEPFHTKSFGGELRTSSYDMLYSVHEAPQDDRFGHELLRTNDPDHFPCLRRP